MKKTGWTLTLIFSVWAIMGCGNAEKKEFPESINIQQEMKADSVKEWIEVERAGLKSIQKGDTISIRKMESGEEIKLHVRRVSETVPSIISISANTKSSAIANATLILRNQQLTGIIDVYEERVRYNVAFDSVEGRPYIQKIKMGKEDELEGGEPLTPKKGNGDRN